MTEHRFNTALIIQDIPQLRVENYREMTVDRLRCQYCQGFYWRVWFDMVQCVGCRSYTMLEVGEDVNPDQLEFDFVENHSSNTLLSVAWIREQIFDPANEHLAIDTRVKDPLSGRSEFIVFSDRLRCRVTGTETELNPKIRAHWLMDRLPQHKNKVLGAKEALAIVKERKS